MISCSGCAARPCEGRPPARERRGDGKEGGRGAEARRQETGVDAKEGEGEKTEKG